MLFTHLTVESASTITRGPSGSAPAASSKKEISLVKPNDSSPKTQQKETMIHPDISVLLQNKIESSKKGGDSSKNREEGISLHIWDFAGHELYYTTHQVCRFINVTKTRLDA